MKKGVKRILAGLLSLCMMLSAWTPAMTAEAATKLVNVALDGTASTEDGENGEYVIGHVNDGDDTTSWQTPGKWPATAVIQMAGGAKISKVVIKLGEEGDNDTGRTALVTVKYAMNGVIDTKFSIGEKRATVDSDVAFELSEASSATHVFVTLSDPQNADGSTGGFYPSVEEIEIYEEQEEEAISSYPNIANQAVITATGNNEKADEGSVNLVDGSDKTLYKFYNAAMTSEQSITLAYEQARSMDAFRIAFENVGAADGTDFAFCYSILAGNGNGEYDTIVERATANRTDNSSQQYSFQEKTYSEVKIVMHSCTTNGGNSAGWPAIAEFEVYGNEILVEDNDNIALRKSVHASSGRNLAKNITDGSKNVAWKGTYYPAYVDIDLEKNYNLNTVEVFTPENGYSQYTIYTSMDGRNFDKLAEKTSTDSAALETGESYNANGKEARIVRVYVEYNSAETAAVINEVRVTGTESGTVVQQRPAIAVNDFADSEYANADGTALTVTADDTYEEVYGIIERQLGPEYEEWFTLELGENPKNNGYDFFELSTVNGKVHVKGNDGVSLATGINHFLKYYCNVNISQVGDQAKMPTAIPAIQGTVHKETKAKVRYSYNYCTLSYSMAFYGEKEWRDELDWLALNGVNVVLDATAQEEVWRRFLGKLGYTHEEAKDFIAGPAYYAWAYMANLSGFGGPVHDSWFEERTELARKNQLSMRKLGMQPALQGYSGMVPTDVLDYAKGDYALTSSDIIEQGEWCGFTRPSMLRTTNAAFEKYAELFYQCQKEVYGDVSDYYATDPFHEGGNTGGMNASDIAEKVLNSMLTADQDGIWIIQAWQGNPTTALLNGLDRITNGAQHALVLDLYAEKDPHYNQTGNSYGDTNEFDDTPWLFCMLNNFGGRLGLHGHLDNLAEDIPVAMNNSEHIAGIGITPEASVNNPVLYDFLFETVWQDDVTKDLEVIDLGSWLDDYATRRYGAESESANKAWDILKDTVYKSDLNNLGQGAPESVVNARPAFTINAASSWGNAVISYDKVELEKAAKLLLEDYDVLANSKGYMYDVANVLQQVLSNSAQEYHKKMVTAYNSRNAEEFEKNAEAFMNIIDYMETVTGTTEYFLLGRWVEQAKALAKNADDFTKELYELNAKALVTTWGSYNQTHGSQNLKDYSNRQWSGLIGDFYKERWELWIDARTKELNGQSYTDVADWFPWEWNWVRSNTVYPTTETPADLKTLGLEIIEKYTSENPAADDSRDIDPTTMSVVAGTASNNDPAGNVLDSNSDSIWHSEWTENENIYSRDKHHLTFTLNELTEIDGMRYLPRQNGVNGIITKYNLYVSSSDSGDDWEIIVEDGVFANDNSWKMVSFDAVNAKRVKLQVIEAMSGENNSKMFASAAEIRFTAPAEVEEEDPIPVDKTELKNLVDNALTDLSGYTEESAKAYQDALTEAEAVLADADATAEEVAAALNDLQEAQKALEFDVTAEKDVTVKAEETITFLDLSGTFVENGLEGVDTSKAIVNVETKTISDEVAKLFDYNTADTTPAIQRYTGASINLSDCMYTFEKIGEDTYYIYSRTENGDEVYLNVSDSTNAVGCPNTITKEEIKVTKVTSQTGVVEGFSFQDMDINNVNGNKYTLQFIKNWGVFNENTTDGNAQKLTTFKVKELSKDENGSCVYKEVTELQDGGSYVIVAAYDSNADGTLDVEYVLHPSTSSTAAKRNDHVALLSGDKADISGNEITITGVSAGDTSAVVGTTKYNIHVIEEKTITLKAGDSVRLFNQTGRFDESGLDTLNTAIANAKVKTISITDDVAKLYSGSGYDGTSIDQNSCIYTFNKNEDGTYYIVAVTEDDKTVYLNPYTGGEQSVRGFPSTKEAERITIESTDNGFKFLDSSENEEGNNYCLTFINEWKVFNEDPSKDPGGDSVTTTTVFKLKELQEMSDGSYDFVEVSAIQDGGQYIIVASTADGDFVLRPSASTSNRNAHVAKVTAEATTENGNEIVISGVSVGETKMTVGNTIYNIRVTAEERYLEIKVGETLSITGTTIEQQPDTEFAVLKENAGNGYLLTGIAKGETTFVIDEVIYHVSVVEIEVASGIGTSLGLEVNKLTMSANNTFDLNIINSDSNEVKWYITDKNGNPAEWATISDDGVIEAKDKSDSKNTYEGYIVAEVDGKVIKTELKISPAPTAEETRLYDVYVGELHHTDVYYGWLYEYDGADNAKAYGSTDLTKVVEGEVIYVSMGKNYENALDFFAKPESGYALTQMGSTGSAGHYMRLEGNAPEKTEFIEKVDVAGYQQYHQIDAAATAALVQKAMDLGCHGAQGFTRYDGHEGVPSILNYRSEKLPTVTKTAIGISGPNGYTDDYREYEDGVKAQIGDYVYFKVVVDTYECEDLVTYNKVMLEDQLEGAVFVNKEESGFIEVSDSNANIIDITTEVDADGYEAKSHDYYVKYQIQAKDVASVSHSVVNTVALTYEYGTHYSSGTFESDAKDDAQILITDVPMQSIVVDYGLPVTYTLERTTKFQEMSEDTLYGKVTVTSGEKEGSEGVYENIITYTPMDVLAGSDAISLIVEIPGSDEQKAGDVCVVGVYPASTVDYEEGFANYTVYGEGSWGDNISRGNGTQSVQYIDQTNSGESTDDDVIQNYGYDEKYAAEYPYTVSEDDADQNVVTAGPSNRTEAVSTTTGNSADFAFTGTGIDIFANGQSEQKDLDGNITQLPTGSVTVMIRNADTGAIEKMMMVNTKVKGGEGITQVQDTIAAAYHMPIVSVNDLEAGKHSVKLIHTLSQEEYEAKTVYPVRLDGFRVYHTLEDESIYREHRESNPNFIEMRNTVLNALNIELLYKEAEEENSEQSIYAEDIAKGLMQVLDKNETGTVGNAIVLDNAGSTDFVSGNAQDLLDNGPKNELFLYKEQTLTFKLKAGLQNVQIGLKALNGQVTVTKPKNVNGAISDETITISSSTDMFYVIGDITEDTMITITNKGENVLSVTELKYFTDAAAEAAFCEMTESDYKEALVAMGYKSQSEGESGDIETSEVKVGRISGDDRYQTAYKVADEYKDILGIEKFDAVIVATGKTFADALSGSYLATVKKAPILLTNGKSKNVTELTDYIEANLKENGTVYILGGTGAVSETTVDAIKAVVGGSGENVKRLFGANRYETNLAILNEATDHGRELIIATGRSFADSLSASATGLPILLVKDEFTEDQLKVLMRFDGAKFYILGGTGAVSQEIQDALYGRGRIYRLSGENRYETSVEVAKKFFADADTAVVASAQSFPDGLCGGPLAAAMKAPMLLAAEGKTKAAASYAQESGIQSGGILGGTGRIPDHSVREIFGLKADVEIFAK